MDSIGTRMKSAREMKGLTVQQLCELIGMSIEDISDLESDCRVLSVSAMIQFSRAFGCSIDWLLTGSTLGAPKAAHRSSCIDKPLSQLESELITKFRSLKEQDRKNIFDFVALLYEQELESKDSAYLTYPNK